MKANKKRPVYLNLFRIRLPVAGVVSVLHRVTGILLVLALPASLYLLQLSLAGPAGFERVGELFASFPARIVAWGMVLVFGHHFFAGIRHLLMDVDLGATKTSARWGAYAIFCADGVLAVIVGVILL